MARSGRGWDAKPPPVQAARGRAVANRRRGPTLPKPDDVPTDVAVDAPTPPAYQPDPDSEPSPDSEFGADSQLWLADPAWVREARMRETDPARLREAMEQFAAGLDRRASGKTGGARGGDGRAGIRRRSTEDGDRDGKGRGAEEVERGGQGRASGGKPGGWADRGSGDRGGARERRGTAGEQESRDPQEVAREICLRLLAVRPRTRAELAQALRKRGIDDDTATAVLHRYDEVGMIDDVAFAKAWVTSRHHGRGLASRALAQELRQRGVSKEDTDEALSGLDSETEARTALDLAARRLRSMHGEPEAIFRRLVGMLARKGYPPGVALRAVKEALASRDSEAGAEGWGDGGWDKQVELIDPDAYEE